MDDLRIDLDEAQRAKEAVFIDARNPQAWESSSKKLPGAIRVPANALESHLEELPKNKLLIPYCT